MGTIEGNTTEGNTMYVIMIDVWNGKRWTTEVFRKGYSTIESAADAMQYLQHHNSDLIKKLSLRATQ